MIIESSGQMLYTEGWKYRLEHALSVKTKLTDMPYRIPSLDGGPAWTSLDADGWMHFRAGYCFDGPSGPTLDTPNSMRPAACHDSPYQAARLGHLPQDEAVRKRVDDFFHEFLLAEGMCSVRAALWHEGVRVGAHGSWKRELTHVHEAPSGRLFLVNPGSAASLAGCDMKSEDGCPPRRMCIVLDPGHGGTNLGCRHPGLQEKTYTLDFCRRLQEALCDRGFVAPLTRIADVKTSFKERSTVADDADADLVVSIHVNALDNPRGRGLEVFHMPDDLLARRLAAAIYDAAPESMKPWSRPAVRAASLDGQGDDAVLRHYDMPAVLVELGFASNADDRAYLLSEIGKEQLVAAIVAGIEKYLGDLPDSNTDTTDAVA